MAANWSNMTFFKSTCTTLAFALAISGPRLNAQQSATQTFVQRARALDAQGRHDLAVENWKQVLLIDPKQPDALAALAGFYQSNGDAAKAQQYRRTLQTANPDASGPPSAARTPAAGNDAKLQEAARLAASHRYPEALTAYRQAFGTTPPDGSWAIAYYQTEAAIPAELPAALDGLRALIKKYPEEPNYQLALGKVLTYKPATRLEGVHILAALRGSAKQNEEARAAWRQAMLWDPAAPAATDTAREYLARYPDPALAASLNSAAQAKALPQPERPRESPLEDEGYKALTAGDLDQATQKFTALLAVPELAGHAQAGLGYVSMQQQNFSVAVSLFEKAKAAGVRTAGIEKALTEARYWSAMAQGNAALKAGDPATAAASYSRARQMQPRRAESVEALGGALLAQQKPEEATAVFADAVKADPQNADVWAEWFNAMLSAGQAQQILDEQPRVPPAVERKLEQRPDYLAVLASAEKATGDTEAATELTARLQTMAENSDTRNAAAGERAADLLLAQGSYEIAAQLSQGVIRADRSNSSAWQTLVESEHLAGDDIAAISAAERMPQKAYESAMKSAPFLMSLSSIYQSRQQFDQAAKLLDRARTLSPGNPPQLQLQAASLALAQGNSERAYNLYRALASAPQTSTQVTAWIGMLAALHAAKHDREAMSAVQRIPPELALRLHADPGYLQVMASVYSESAQPARALDCLRAVTAIYQQRQQPTPFAVDTQFAWLLLNAGDQRQLGATLNRLGQHADLTDPQRQELQNIWAAWSIRRAEADYKSGNGKHALAILQAAQQIYPHETALRRELGTMFVRTGNPAAALELYKTIDWESATVSDYTAGIDAAIAARRSKFADQWLRDGLERFPGDDQLLSQGARIEEQRGNFKKAQNYLRAEIGDSPAQPADESSPDGMIATDPAAGQQRLPEHALAELLGASSTARSAAPGVSAPQEQFRDQGFEAPHREAKPAHTSRFDLDESPASGSLRLTEPRPIAPWPAASTSNDTPASSLQMASASLHTLHLQPVSYHPDATDSGSSNQDDQPDIAENSTPDPFAGGPVRSLTAPTHAAMLSSTQKAEDELAALESRYSPWYAAGGAFDSHTGTQGFDQLQRFEAETEASTVIGGSVRLSAITRAVLLDSGAPLTTSNYRYGSGSQLPQSDQFASGIGGELQIATKSVQASVGYSPSNFLVSHMIASLTLKPGDGSFAFRAYREPVKDTLLSYAGAQDPRTGEIWGGVVASGASLQLGHGTANSGFYGSLDGQQLTGRNVQSNNRIAGGAGAYWMVYGNQYGALKMGANFFAMHYAHNERYFTIGQGGYFSPNAFLLMNAPFTWEGHPQHNIAYTLSGSLGVQTYQDGPAMAHSLIVGNGQQSTTGSSYDFHARVAYRLDNHWSIEGLLDTNNAREYQDRMAGFGVRYLIRPQPVEGGPTGLVDPKEIRPLEAP